MKNDFKKIIDPDKINKKTQQMGDNNIVVQKINKKKKNIEGNRFIRILPDWGEKINKLIKRINLGNFEKKEIII